MVTLKEARSQVSAFLANRIPLDAFEDWSADYSQRAYRDQAKLAQSVAQRIRAILNAFEDDSTDLGLREELANALLPFVEVSSVFVSYTMNKPQDLSLDY